MPNLDRDVVIVLAVRTRNRQTLNPSHEMTVHTALQMAGRYCEGLGLELVAPGATWGWPMMLMRPEEWEAALPHIKRSDEPIEPPTVRKPRKSRSAPPEPPRAA